MSWLGEEEEVEEEEEEEEERQPLTLKMRTSSSSSSSFPSSSLIPSFSSPCDDKIPEALRVGEAMRSRSHPTAAAPRELEVEEEEEEEMLGLRDKFSFKGGGGKPLPPPLLPPNPPERAGEEVMEEEEGRVALWVVITPSQARICPRGHTNRMAKSRAEGFK